MSNSDLDDYETTYLVYAPGQDPHAWQLGLERLGDALKEAFPGARARVRQDNIHGGEPYLSFWGTADDGTVFDGAATVHGRDCLYLVDIAAPQAAVFIEWLRDSFLPKPDSILFTTELAMEAGIATDWHIPAKGGREQIAEELLRHLEIVEAA
ncbi:hypothetical protein AB0I22_39490 [Streptomyces sp. NPDC050610]|uniref:hypothetical protein n=1 Tax=Streptomyces sp. NPDC050610 TaxID=3157097 RepID=UPI0034321B9E